MPNNQSLTENESKYLKLIYRKQREDSSKVRTSSIAERTGVRAATATEMLQKLAEKGLLTHEPYHGVELTEKGVSEAQHLLRKHRLLELLFHDLLNYEPRESCDEASKIDHQVSDRLVNRICETYGHPDACPCGETIFRIPACDSGKREGKET